MISLAGRDILHSWGKFVLTGIGLGLLIGVTLTMAGVYRGMVDDARALLDNSGADLWVVQQDTQGPYAESSSLRDDAVRSVVLATVLRMAAPALVRANGERTQLDSWRSVTLWPGDTLRAGSPRNSRCGVVAVRGLVAPLVLGSASTYMRALLGGYGGRALAAGDPMGALKRVALRTDAPALALRGTLALTVSTIGADGGERQVDRLVLDVDQRGVAMVERAAAAVLTGEPDGAALHEQRTEGQQLGGGPVDRAGADGVGAALHLGQHLGVDREVLGERDLGGRDALHGPRDLLGVLDAGDLPSEDPLLCTGHAGSLGPFCL